MTSMPTAVVTGGAVRLGQALALRLAERGWNVALHYNSSSTETTVRRILSLGVRCSVYACDFTDAAAAEALLPRVLADFPDVELLVNSAANFIQENIESTRNETLFDTLNLNLVAPFLLMREYKRRVNRGMIVNILDQRIAKSIPTFAAYSVSKAGLGHLTHLAAVEWGETVRVNGIAPGLILPPPGGPEDYCRREARHIPLKRHGNPADIVRALDYLLDSPFVNGEVLFVDGGESKSSRGTTL
jgi:NAD(P)-dependent dehydrogenase (short-subunit alcohol dehydrogenase family)